MKTACTSFTPRSYGIRYWTSRVKYLRYVLQPRWKSITFCLFEAWTGQSMAMLSPIPTNIDKPYRKKAKHRSNKLGSPRLHPAYLASTWRKVTQVNRRKECTKLWLLASRCVLNWSKKKPAVLPAIRRQKEPSQVCISYYKTKNPTSHVIDKTC